jgi:hypothetical protein
VKPNTRSTTGALREVAKNVDDDDLYFDPYTLRRLPEAYMGKASELFGQVIEFN